MGDLRFTHGDVKRLLFSNYPPWKRHLSPCHPVERTRISYFALLQRLRMQLSSRKPHDVDQRHGFQQEIRGSVAEGPAVAHSLDLGYGP
jgi:hypothetical protein